MRAWHSIVLALAIAAVAEAAPQAPANANRNSSSPAWAEDTLRAGKPVSTWSYQTTTRLRGFGSLNAEGSLYRLGDGKASLVILTAESPALAEVTASKYLNDITHYGPVASETLPGFKAAVVHLADGSSIAVGMNGKNVYIAWAEKPHALRELLTSAGARDWKKPSSKTHPRYLDRFDNETYGLWAGIFRGAIMSFITVPGCRRTASGVFNTICAKCAVTRSIRFPRHTPASKAR